MSDERTLDRIEHMLAAIAGIERLTRSKSLGDYADDVDTAAAVERHFERLSEASRHLPESIRQKHPEVPWRAVAVRFPRTSSRGDRRSSNARRRI